VSVSRPVAIDANSNSITDRASLKTNRNPTKDGDRHEPRSRVNEKRERNALPAVPPSGRESKMD